MRENAAVFASYLNVGAKRSTTDNFGNTKELQASHLCSSGNCVYPAHIVRETEEANIRRDHCKTICSEHCECNPKCVPQVNGIVVSCKIHTDECPEPTEVEPGKPK